MILGEHIKEIVEERGMTYSEFARRINKSPQNASSIFTRKTVDTETLQKISRVLSYDFFAYLSPFKDGDEEMRRGSGSSLGISDGGVINVQIDLDGTQSTLNKWFTRLAKINATLVR